MFDTPLVGSFTYNTKCLEATVVGIWCYMNKTHLNIVNWKGHWPLHLFLAIFRKCGLWWEKKLHVFSDQDREVQRATKSILCDDKGLPWPVFMISDMSWDWSQMLVTEKKQSSNPRLCLNYPLEGCQSLLQTDAVIYWTKERGITYSVKQLWLSALTGK